VGSLGLVDLFEKVFGCVNLGWRVKDVKEELTNLLKSSVKVANGTNLATLGELWQGAGKGHKNILLVTIGTGIGGKIAIGEKIVVGRNGKSGEIRHLTINKDEKKICACGKRGCVEQYGFEVAMVKMARDRIKNTQGIKTTLTVDNLTAKMIFGEARIY